MNFHHTILIRTNIPNGNREMLGCGETLSLFISRQVQNFSAVHRQVSPSEKFSANGEDCSCTFGRKKEVMKSLLIRYIKGNLVALRIQGFKKRSKSLTTKRSLLENSCTMR